jgi:hypothetical protein
MIIHHLFALPQRSWRSAEMKIRMNILLGVALAQMSCILPVPHRRVHAHGIEGKVINRNTNVPIQGAKVTSVFTGNELARTNSTGMFRIKPDYGWHGAYLVGPISYSLLPHFDIESPPPPVRISAAGYLTAEFGRREGYSQLQRDGTKEFPLVPK